MRNGTLQKSKSRSGLHLVESRSQVERKRATAQTAAALDYYSRMEQYAQKIRRTGDVGDIIGLLEEALLETRALHTADEVAAAREQLINAEQRIEHLKCELELVNQLVREDQLTGALNRRGLDDALAREAARTERKAAPLCLALIDLDDFKRLNDTFGHPAGDCVLMHLVSVVREFIRSNDLIGRYGGEEFMLLLPDSRIDEAVAVIERLRRGLAAKPIAWGANRLAVTFSAGIAEHRAGEKTRSLIERADSAMYEAKRLGKNRALVAH